MITYETFLEENYKSRDKLNILSFSTGKARNYIARVETLKNASGQYTSGNIDVYMSMNPLVYKNNKICRDKAHVESLKWLWADLDYYNSAYQNFSKQQIIGLLELDYFEKKIPVPTYIIDSGRGLYLLWKVEEHINAYPRWVRMQNYLCEQLNEFGADRKVASDSARVLRQLGSINSKSGTAVQVISQWPNKYSLTNLIREYAIPSLPSEKMIRYAKSISKNLMIDLPNLKDREAVKAYIKENKEPARLFQAIQSVKKKPSKITYIGTEYSLLYTRIKDLEKLLLKHRDKENSSREHILFLYRYWQLCITDDKELSLDRVLQLNDKLENLLSTKEVICATASAEKYYDAGKSFRCSNAYVINTLDISESEMKELSVFVSASERKRRKSERNRKEYLRALKNLGKKTKEEQIKDRRKRVYKLLIGGLGSLEICKRLNISRATFYADKQVIERYLAVKKQKKQSLTEKYVEFCRKKEERCLKISAFVLNMSFRTCSAFSSRSFIQPTIPPFRLFCWRFWRTWGMDQLSWLSTPYFSCHLASGIVNNIDILC